MYRIFVYYRSAMFVFVYYISWRERERERGEEGGDFCCLIVKLKTIYCRFKFTSYIIAVIVNIIGGPVIQIADSSFIYLFHCYFRSLPSHSFILLFRFRVYFLLISKILYSNQSFVFALFISSLKKKKKTNMF